MSKENKIASDEVLEVTPQDSTLEEFIEEDIIDPILFANGDIMELPTVIVAGIIVFPGVVVHMDITEEAMAAAVKEAFESDRLLFLPLTKRVSRSWPDVSNFCTYGTVAKLLQVVTTSDEPPHIIIKGICRAELCNITAKEPYVKSEVIINNAGDAETDNETRALMRVVKDTFDEYAQSIKNVPGSIKLSVLTCSSPDELADFMGAYAIGDYDIKMKLLQLPNPAARLKRVLVYLRSEIEIVEVQKEILEKTAESIDQNQRSYFLRTQIQALEEELGEAFEDDNDADDYEEKIRALKVDSKIKDTLLKECERLHKLPEASQEAFVIRVYLDTCLELPWNKSSRDKLDIPAVAKSLDKNHYGLEKVKERILEYLAVRKLTPDVKGQIICLVGPPGVGKTSIAQSMAAAINRKSERIALGGVHDEAEIRGHRRTYVAAMPGRIIAAVKSAGTKNPVIILDEIDKLSSDHRGDPTSALLEVLDPEQNVSFRDHYIDLPFDLSQVLFVTTANDEAAIPAPLRDRMEIIEIGSYTREEKFNIAKKHLVPKQMKNNGLSTKTFKLTNGAIYDIIDYYTREAGVRALERIIASLMRKAAKKVASGEDELHKIDSKNLSGYLGPKKYKDDSLSAKDEIGLVNGLAWTSVGGETLPIEAAVVPGTGKIVLTGSLGDVMKESARTAITCVRTRTEQLKIDPNFYKECDIHIHAPEGAVPKDGPSAGITMTTAIVSALTKRPVNRLVAMTGEITLRGAVLPIGGLKEKSMGAYKKGIQTIIIPKDNEPDIYEIDSVVKENVSIVPVETIDEVFAVAFTESGRKDKPSRSKKTERKSAEV